MWCPEIALETTSRWLRFSAEYSYTDRDSTDSTVNYQRNFILFTVGATL